MNLGQLAIRGVVGPLFVGHGTQKLFGWFGGHGPEGTGGFFESQLGLAPGKRHAMAAGAAETAGGALITLGALTPVASAAISGTMVTAIRKAHAQNGIWSTQGGWEYNAVLLTAMVALTDAGPGKPSVDEARFPWMKGPALALLQLAAGVAGSYLATERFNQAAPGQGAQAGQVDDAGDPATTEATSGPLTAANGEGEGEGERTEFGRFKQPATDASAPTETA
jgi:putative oxidoreductase